LHEVSSSSIDETSLTLLQKNIRRADDDDDDNDDGGSPSLPARKRTKISRYAVSKRDKDDLLSEYEGVEGAI
jgi:hypothetical protein